MNAGYYRVPRGSDEADRGLLTPSDDGHVAPAEPSHPEPKRYQIPLRVFVRLLVLIFEFTMAITLSASAGSGSYTYGYSNHPGRVASVIFAWLSLVASTSLFTVDLSNLAPESLVTCNHCHQEVPVKVSGHRLLMALADIAITVLLLISSIIALVLSGNRPAMLVGGIFGVLAA